MALPEITTDPVVLAALVLVVAAVIQYQRTLTWPEYVALHTLKVRFLPLLDRVWPHAVHVKHHREDPEFITTVTRPPRIVWKRLVRNGAAPHLINSVKRRPVPPFEQGDTQLSVAHAVWFHDSGDQTEAFLFTNDDGTTDVYSHYEPSVLRPEDHLSGEQVNGDPKGVVRMALGLEVEATDG
jgi:hypothetical protein